MKMKEDVIEFEILADGTVSIKTDQVSGTNHVSADQLLRMIEQAVGGEVKRTKRNRLHVHAHLTDALHAHASDGHTHDHEQGHSH